MKRLIFLSKSATIMKDITKMNNNNWLFVFATLWFVLYW